MGKVINKSYKIVSVKHLTYSLKLKEGSYFFKTTDDVKINDIVYCQTQYGLAIGVVRNVLKTIDEAFDFMYSMPRLIDLKECKKEIEFPKKFESDDSDLPF